MTIEYQMTKSTSQNGATSVRLHVSELHALRFAGATGRKRRPHAKTYIPNGAKRAKMAAVKINKPAGSLEDGDKPSDLKAEQAGGRVSSIVSQPSSRLLYKAAQKPTPQNKVLENVRWRVVEREKGIHKNSLPQTVIS